MDAPDRASTAHVRSGIAIALVETAATVLAIIAVRRSWPSAELAPYLAAAAIIALVASAVLWARRIYYVGIRSVKAGVVAALAPVLVATALVTTVVATPEPSRPQPDRVTQEFNSVRPEFVEEAQRLLDEPGRTYSGRMEIGPFHIRTAYDNSVGEVYFHEARGDRQPSSSNPGWVYSPHGIPRGFDETEMQDVGGHWYRFTNVSLD
ncbi:hypothetical protein [Antrihabitans spumae]|uniref:DUF1109 domain-containing protein n=1 Tax=Antrihabitans spumae TaxID=3373370 RepID=A0ABW7KUJ4_9NOCA